MNAGAKVQLSKEELVLVSDPGWILTKNSIMGRVVELMAGLSERLGPGLAGLRERVAGEDCGPNWDTPKISRGENYQGLPYVILDQPRVFGREHILAVRTLFWWGHYFSVTLHLKGRYKDLFLPVIQGHAGELMEAGFHLAVSGDEWRHELESEDYRLLKEDSMHALEEYPFLKLSAKCPLDKWNEAPDILRKLNEVLIRALTNGR